MANRKQTFPNLRQAVMAWASDTKVFIVAKRQNDYLTEEIYFEKNVKMFRVPTGQNLEMKPEGQRKWNNETIYADISLDLKVDDIIIFDCVSGQRFRVLSKTDWNQFGYVEYAILSDYAKGFQ
jgi:hypothetical protein